MTLFAQRGYDNVTVNEIAENAGLTKRTFFNHFPDKSDILFAGSAEFEHLILEHLREADPGTSPSQAVGAALSAGGAHLARYAPGSRIRANLIESSDELYERHLRKMAGLSTGIADVLAQRGQDPKHARLLAQIALIAFEAAYTESLKQPDHNFDILMRQAIDDARAALH